jgi:DNA-binding NtrC family response regulator
VLEAYSWPGNIRELRNVIERAVLLCGGGTIRPEHLPMDKMRATYAAYPRPAAAPGEASPPPASPPAGPPPGGPADAPAAHPLDALYPGDAERDRIIATLERCRGNQTRAAKVLGMSRRTLIYRLERYGLPRPRKPAR